MSAMSGKIKFYNTVKGYGFIIPDDGGKDIFIHARAFEAAGITPTTIKQDDKIRFDIELNKRTKKEQACDVVRA